MCSLACLDMLKLPWIRNLDYLWNGRLDCLVHDSFSVKTGSIDTLYLFNKFFQMFFCPVQILIPPIWTFYMIFSFELIWYRFIIFWFAFATCFWNSCDTKVKKIVVEKPWKVTYLLGSWLFCWSVKFFSPLL